MHAIKLPGRAHSKPRTEHIRTVRLFSKAVVIELLPDMDDEARVGEGEFLSVRAASGPLFFAPPGGWLLVWASFSLEQGRRERGMIPINENVDIISIF